MQREMIATGKYAWDVATMGLGMNLALRGPGICDLEPLELGKTVAGECREIFGHDAFYFVMLDKQGLIAPGGYWEDTDFGAAAPEPTAAR